MGLSNRSNKGKEQINQPTEPSVKSSTLCDKCLRNNSFCPYENQPTTTTNNGRGFMRSNDTCDAYADFANAKYQGSNHTQCPRCGSHDTGKQLDRFECKTCGRLFS